jgi:hypothetical protein
MSPGFLFEWYRLVGFAILRAMPPNTLQPQSASSFSALQALGTVRHSCTSGSITFDYRKLPLLRVNYVGTVNDQSFQDYINDLAAVAKIGRPYLLLADATDAGVPSAKQRMMQTQAIKEYRSLFASVCKGAAFVIDSMMVRGALTAMLWVQPLPYDHIVVATVREAEEWLQKQLPY